MKHAGFIVIYDDGMGVSSAYGADKDCPGAIEYGEPVALFTDRKQAAKAIRISVANARLREAQGLLVNTDFTDGRKHVRIVPLAKWGIA